MLTEREGKKCNGHKENSSQNTILLWIIFYVHNKKVIRMQWG